MHFPIQDAGNITIRIYNITGQMVKELCNGYEGKGNYNINWNGTGTYGPSLA